jgi:uncharacterized protein YjbJ (UPF0337 family)
MIRHGATARPSTAIPAPTNRERLASPTVLLVPIQQQEAELDKEHVKGAADKAKGAIKEAAGKVMGEKGMQAEGKMDKAKGAAHSAVGDAKDAMKHAKE